MQIYVSLRDMSTGLFVLVLLVNLSSVVLSNRGDGCSPKNNNLFHRNKNEIVLHDNNSELKCCLKIKCQKGTQAVFCSDDDPLSTTCEACPANTYMDQDTDSFDGLSCLHMRKCNRRGYTIEREGTKTTNRDCKCDVTKGYYAPIGFPLNNPASCKYKRCEDGFQLNIAGQCIPAGEISIKVEKTLIIKTTPPVTVIPTAPHLPLTSVHSQWRTNEPNSLNALESTESYTIIIIITAMVSLTVLMVLCITTIYLWRHRCNKTDPSKRPDERNKPYLGSGDTTSYHINAHTVMLNETGKNGINHTEEESEEEPHITRGS